MALDRRSKSGFYSQTESVYKLLREIEKTAIRTHSDPMAPFSSIDDFYKLPAIQNFLQTTPQDREQSKLQEMIFHFKLGLSLQQFEFFLVPFERFLGKNLKDDEFVVLKSDHLQPQKKFPIFILLENIRSSFNVGSFFRLADGFGVRHVYLGGYSPHPSKTAMGSETSVAFSMEPNPLEKIHALKNEGVRIVGLETTTLSKNYTDPYPLNQSYCFVFGNERFGINHETLRNCDEIRQIPMHGTKNSMNVAVCAGIVLSEWVRQRKIGGPDAD